MTGTARLGDDALELVNLLLGTAKGTELDTRGGPKLATAVSFRGWESKEGRGVSYSLLGELTGALVLGVTQQLDDTLLVGSEAVERELVS